jgi:hypothetical protein
VEHRRFAYPFRKTNFSARRANALKRGRRGF